MIKDEFNKNLETTETEPVRVPDPTPGETLRSMIGWVIAALLVIIIPTAILCKDPGTVIAIIGATCGMAGVMTWVVCFG